MVPSLLVAALLLLQAPVRDSRPPTDTATVSGRVTERDSGRPLPRIVVSLEAPPSVRLEAVTDGDGRYTIARVPPGAYTLSAAPEPHHSTFLPMRFGEPTPVAYLGTGTKANIELKPAESRTGADFALWRGLAIEGRVVDPWDQPMTNVDVRVSRADGARGGLGGGVTNDAGRYRLYGLLPGRYRVCAEYNDNGGVTEPGGLRLVTTCHMSALSAAEGSDVVLQSADASGIDIRVQRVGTYTVEGTVSDGAGAPVRGAWVAATRAAGDPASSRTTTDAAGQFLLKGLLAGRYLVSASIGGAPMGDPNPAARAHEMGFALVDVQGNTSAGTITVSEAVTVSGVVSFEGSPAPSPRQLKLLVFATLTEQNWSMMQSRQPQAAVDEHLRFQLKGLYRLPSILAIRDIPDQWALKSMKYLGRDITYLPTDFGGARPDALVEIVLTNRVARPSVRLPAGPPLQVYILPANPAIRRFGMRVVYPHLARDGVLSLGALLPGDYLVAAVAPDVGASVFGNAERLEALAGVATRLTLRAGDEPILDLPAATLPPQWR